MVTPCMAYLRIAKDSKYSFLLESVVNGEGVARYSFIGAGNSRSNFYSPPLVY
jgi:anthranilate synthase component 1